MLGTKISKSNWAAESRYCKFLKVIGLRKADTAKYHCLYVQAAVAFQTPGVFFDSHSIYVR